MSQQGKLVVLIEKRIMAQQASAPYPNFFSCALTILPCCKFFSCALTPLCLNFFLCALTLLQIFFVHTYSVVYLAANFFRAHLSCCAQIFFFLRASDVLLSCFLLTLLFPNFFIFRAYLMWCYPAFHLSYEYPTLLWLNFFRTHFPCFPLFFFSLTYPAVPYPNFFVHIYPAVL